MHRFQCHIIDQYQDHILFFIDGSKDRLTGAGAAFVVQGWNAREKLRFPKCVHSGIICNPDGSAMD